jgi:cellulose synthase/poly-beta-1,6-N-acetylglucosamine synthase-like glycosyltransferase
MDWGIAPFRLQDRFLATVAMKHSKTPWSVAVVIPARNEQSTIECSIGSVQNALNRARVDHWVVVVADDCTDRTAELARRVLEGTGEVIEVRVRSAGAARREGANRVLRHWKHLHPSRIWLANTDADTCVNEDWIAVQLSYADEGVTAVAGIVQLEAGGSAAAHEVHKTSYGLSAEGTHTHVHGANFSVRADAYEDAGGWSNLALAEDHCLWKRLRRRGWRVSSPVSSVVITSSRLKGRAQGGFADTLRLRVAAFHAQS